MASGLGLRSTLKMNNLRNMRKNLNKTIDSALIKTAEAIVHDASVNARKDTEFLAESIHLTTSERSDYAFSFASSNEKFNEAKANGRTPKGKTLGANSQYHFFPEKQPEEEGVVLIVVGAVHGIDNEMDISGRKSFLLSAVQKNKGMLTANIRRSFQDLSVKANLISSKRY